MKNKFKYDYNNKLFLINLVISLIFFILSVLTFKKLIGFILSLIIAIILLFNSFFMRMQGVKIKKNSITIVDQLLIRKLCIKDINYVSLKQIPKKTKSKLYGFFNEFFLSKHLHIALQLCLQSG